MIERLCVRGFQSLDSIDIELGRFTVLVGPTNSGKSAIRRAIEALVHNDPATGRLREGSTYFGIQLTLEQGAVVELWKGGKRNSYVVGGTEIAKPGATCPEPVRALVRLDDVNFASQFDAPFLLAETPSAVARTLGELTNISVLFEGIREATRRSKSAAQQVKHHATQIDVLADKLAGYDDLPIEQDQLQRIHGTLLVASEADHAARTTAAAAAAAQQTIDSWWVQVRELSAQPDWEWIEGTMQALDVTLGEMQAWDGAVARAQSLVAIIEAATAEITLVPFDPVMVFANIDTVMADVHRLRAALEWVQTYTTAIATAEHELLPTEGERAAEEELASMDTCPLCGAPIYEGMTI